MIRMLSANDASLISAGIGEPPHKQEVQKLLNIIENEVRYAAFAGRNKAPLLGEEFKGWDAANISNPHDVMAEVFQVLSEEGYSFHTEQMLQIGNVASTCSQVPYPHSVVTWPKTTTSTQAGVGSAPRCPDDGIAEGFRGDGKTELLTREAKDLLEGRPLSHKELIKIANSLGKDLEYVDPIFAQPTMTPRVMPMTTLPAPGTPMQLIEHLRQKGYKMQGFGCLVEVKHKPTNWDTCQAIGSLVLNLLEVHRSGSPKEPTTASLPLKGYPEIDFKYLRGTFAEVGLLVHQKGGTIECRWPVSAWDYFTVDPVTIIEGDW